MKRKEDNNTALTNLTRNRKQVPSLGSFATSVLQTGSNIGGRQRRLAGLGVYRLQATLYSDRVLRKVLSQLTDRAGC